MPTGWAPATASALLNTISGGSEFGQIHTGDPGAAGTANQSVVTTRSAITHSTSAGGAPLALTNSPSWTAAATEAIGYLSVWDAASGGNFRYSIQLDVTQGVNSGDVIVLDDLDISVAPQAA